MKIKVKGLVFVGAAAAIMLSAGAANAAKTARTSNASDIVTSQKYADLKYEYVENKAEAITEGSGGNIASDDAYPSVKAATDYLQKKVGGTMTSNTDTDGKLVTATSTAGSVVYTDITKSSSNDATNKTGWYSSNATTRALSDYEVPSEKAIVEYVDTGLNTLTSQIGGSSAKQGIATADWQVGNNDGEWSTVVDGTYTTALTQVAAKSGNNPETVKVDLKSTMIQSANTTNDDVNTGSNATKLATAGVVQIKQTADKYQVSKNKEWTDASGAVNGGTYVNVDKTRTDGGVDLDITSTMIQTANSDANGNNPADNVNVDGNATKLATAGVVQRKQTADKYQVSKNKEWTDLYGAVAVDGNGFITKTDNTSTGAVTLNVNAVKTAAAIGNASNADSTTLTTDYAVQQYVQGITHGNVLPEMPAACKGAGQYCALVFTGSGTGGDNDPKTGSLAWTVMAGSTTPQPQQ